jgi:ABC-type dipeptide/oligopeptide/nickel transport system permease subunit
MTVSTRRKRFNLLMTRAKGFWDMYKQNKKGLVGIAILFLFVLFAFFGPMLTDNHPVLDWDVGGRRVPPVWFKNFPGYQHLVPNLDPVENVGFEESDELTVWDIETISEDSFTVTHSTEGYERGSGPGSMLITLNRDSTGPSAADIKISKTFSWDYSNPPKRFRSTLSFKAEDIEGTSLNIRLVLVDTKRQEHVLWQRDISSDTSWSYPEYKVDSYSIKIKMMYPDAVFADPAHIIFNGTGSYEYYFLASFDNIDADSTGTTHLYVDDLNIELMGTCYGILGTDQWGRDLYSQLAHGAKTSLFVGLLSAFISVSIGLIVGLFAGFSGGLVDEVSMRFADMLLVIPFLPLLLVLIAILGQSVLNIILVISLLGWMGFSRTVRSQVLSLKERAFIEAVPAAIVSEASLSFLGLGDPSIMSWGQMLYNVVFYAAIKELYWVIPPGLCIALLAVSFVMMGFSTRY